MTALDVKGWLICGPWPWAWAGSLAPVALPPPFLGVPPDAGNYPQGTVIEWIAAPGGLSVVLVCVRVPIVPGSD